MRWEDYPGYMVGPMQSHESFKGEEAFHLWLERDVTMEKGLERCDIAVFRDEAKRP